MPTRLPNKRSPNRRRWAAVGAAVAVAAVLGGAVAATGSNGPSYRTAGVERADVEATLDSAGSIQPISQATLSFPISGNVRSVSATVGQHVAVGQTLAQLDTTSLEAQVAAAQSAVAAAAARLAADQLSQTNPTVTAAVAPTAFSTTSTLANANTTPANPVSAARDRINEQQTRLVADQHRADQDLAQAKRDLATETSRCQAFVTPSNDVAAPNPPNQPKRHGRASPEVATTAAAPDPSQCQDTITTVLADQNAVDHDQQAVAADLPALSAAIAELMATAQVTHPVESPRPTAAAAGTGRTTSTTAGSPAGTADHPARASASSAVGTNRTAPAVRPASPEQLASDQAAIDEAQAQLTEANQAHDQAELRSPIDGIVGTVTISAGESVAGNPGSSQIVIIGPGDHQVTTTVSDTNVGSVRVGDAATVIPGGSSVALPGQVVSIGLLGSTGSAGSVGYPVTIGLAGTPQQLFTGQSAAVSIMLAHASNTLSVPSSAVHRTGSSSVVSVLRHGSPTIVRVTLGITGPIRTEVLAGLNPDDQVILADLSQPLPTTDVQNIRRATGGAGGRSGG